MTAFKSFGFKQKYFLSPEFVQFKILFLKHLIKITTLFIFKNFLLELFCYVDNTLIPGFIFLGQ